MVKSPSDAPSADPPLLLDRVGVELTRQLAVPLPAGLYVVATLIGNLGDISLRALATLHNAQVICCEDTRHSRTLLAHFAIDRPLRAYHEHNAEAERPRILEQIGQGKAVALISDAGTPLISDPGYKLVREALDLGFRVTSLPGASALIAGLSVCGLPTDTFLFAGFLPAKDGARRTGLAELATTDATLVLYEAPTRVGALLTAIAETLGNREVVVARELTKQFEELRRGPAATLAAEMADAEVKGEVVVLIGPPAPVEIDDAAIEAELQRALPLMSLKDAVRAVSDRLSVSRARVYDLGLRLKAEGHGR